MLRRTESYAGNAQRNIVAPYPQKQLLQCVLSEQQAARASTDHPPSTFVDHRNFEFKKLEDVNSISFKDYCGPTPESNWVIPGVLLVGAYPASQDDEETYELITSILKEHVTKFVCLQQEYRDEGVTVEMWRSGLALRPYFHDVRMVVHNKAMFPDLQGFNIVDRDALSFVHFPIRDCGITDDERVLELSRTLVKAISEGEIIYLHCWGGHGRTGTLVCIMLHLMYSLDSVEAMTRCQMVHDLRKCPVVVGSPQTQTQRDQVTRVIRRLMTNTSFHRRTLSDIFSHAGAARLSVLMDEESQRSPRSEVASVPFCTSREMDCRLVSECATSSGFEDDKDDDDDDNDEDEGVIAMGLDCLDNDNDLNFVDVSEVAENQASFYPHYIPVMSNTQVTRDNVDSYIDSDERASVSGSNVHMNAAAAMVVTCQLQCHPPSSSQTANMSSSAFADHHRRQNFQNLLEATDQCGAGLKDSLPQNEGSIDYNLKEKDQSMLSIRRAELNREFALQGKLEQEAHQQRQQQLVPMNNNAYQEDQEQPHCTSDSNSQSLTCMGNGSSCVSSGTGTDQSLVASIAVSVCANHDSASSEHDGRQTTLESGGILFHVGDQHSGQCDVRSEQTLQPSPVPIPPPASCRPSTACSSSSSSGASPGVLAGLRNFRLQWGGGAGHSINNSAAGQPIVTPSDDNGTSTSTPAAPSKLIVGTTPAEFSGILSEPLRTDR